MKKQGFSLLELLLASVLFTIGLVSLINVFSIGISDANQAKKFALAKNLAEEKLETIRNLAYGNVIFEDKLPITGFPDFMRQVIVTETQTGLKQVKIDVFWQDKSGEVNISLYSLVSDI